MTRLLCLSLLLALAPQAEKPILGFGERASTEQLRMALRRYRAFLQRLHSL